MSRVNLAKYRLEKAKEVLEEAEGVRLIKRAQLATLVEAAKDIL